MGTIWDAPNQQVVRADESPPWEEGTGGPILEPKLSGLDTLTKEQLLERAAELGLDLPKAATKQQIQAAIEAA